MDLRRFYIGPILAVFTLSLSMSRLSAQEIPDSTSYNILPGVTFILVSQDPYATPPVISDSLFDASAQGIRFKVNRTELQPTDPFIPFYLDLVVPWLKTREMELGQVYIKGAASPEGPYENNVRLSRARTQKLIEFLGKGLGQDFKNVPISAQSVTEDYQLLVKLMRQANDPDYERVEAIWLSCNGNELMCKKKLQALDKGKVWKRLLKEYFPSLRQARSILWFVRKKDYRNHRLDPVNNPFWEDIQLSAPATRVAPMEYTPMPLRERRHLLAVRTNLVHDFLYVPKLGFSPGANIQLEYYPLDGHYTYNAGFTFTNTRKWDQNKFFQIRDLQLEVRRYFKGEGAFVGPYLGLYGEGTIYGIGFDKATGWEGEGGGAGLSAGWTWPLNRKGNLRLEVSASLGVFATLYDPYVYGNPISGVEDGLYYYNYHGNTSDFKKRNHFFFWFGPTNVGIHLTYDILYRK